MRKGQVTLIEKGKKNNFSEEQITYLENENINIELLEFIYYIIVCANYYGVGEEKWKIVIDFTILLYEKDKIKIQILYNQLWNRQIYRLPVFNLTEDERKWIINCEFKVFNDENKRSQIIKQFMILILVGATKGNIISIIKYRSKDSVWEEAEGSFYCRFPTMTEKLKSDLSQNMPSMYELMIRNKIYLSTERIDKLIDLSLSSCEIIKIVNILHEDL